MPKQVNDIKAFLVRARKADAKEVRIKKSGAATKFKLRCSKYLYTLTIKGDQEKADKLKASLPPKMTVKVVDEKEAKKDKKQ